MKCINVYEQNLKCIKKECVLFSYNSQWLVDISVRFKTLVIVWSGQAPEGRQTRQSATLRFRETSILYFHLKQEFNVMKNMICFEKKMKFFYKIL